MTRFHNPYHFVPVVTEPANGGLALPVGNERANEFAQSIGHRTHDRYPPDTHSGRIVCKLTTESPLIVGAHQQRVKDAPTVVQMFKIGEKPAIPASSLRGLISSVAEAATNSAMRVLEATWRRSEVGFGPNRTHAVDGSAVDAFAKISADLLPLGKDRRRQQLSIAELLFGFVEDREPTSEQASALTFASRLRFAHGRQSGTTQPLERVVLKELSTPKPPRATFYFQPARDSRQQAVTTKVPSETDRPKGRKFYLLHDPNRPAASDRPDWKSGLQSAHDRQVVVEPVSPPAEFWFHVDFVNLSDAELDLLLYAIVPTAEYRHRLGLGKPIGLGRCQIQVAGLFLVDRRERYLALNGDAKWTSEPRYHSGWTDQVMAECIDAIYDMERRATGLTSTLNPSERAKRFRQQAPPSHAPVLLALEMLGKPDCVLAPVHYPTRDTKQLEDRLYEWFSIGPNDYLPPLPGHGRHLPMLDTTQR